MYDVLSQILGLFSPEVAVIVMGVLYVVAHFVKVLPPVWSSKIPDFVMIGLNAVSLNYGKELAAKTDIKGNIIDAGDQSGDK